MSAVEAPTQLPRVSRLATRAAGVQRDYPILQTLFLVVLFSIGASTIDGFTSSYTLKSILVLSAILGISALGQTFCLLIGGLDVSIPGWILVGATVTVELLGQDTGWTTWEVMLVLVTGALVAGGLTGLICFYFRVPALVITLAVGAIAQGAVYAWSQGSVNGIPPSWIGKLTSPATETFGIGIPPVVFIWGGIIAIAWIVLQRSYLGAWVYSTGNNRRAAELALVPTAWVWAGGFALSALSATFAGVLLAGYGGAGDINIGTPYLWNGLTAVLIGGTAFGTRGDYVRTAIGAIIVVVLTVMMTGYGYGPADQNILFGAIIIVVVSLYRRDRRLRDQI